MLIINRLMIQQKLLISFLATALMTACLGGMSLYFTDYIGDRGEIIVKKLTPLGDAATEIKLLTTRAHLLVEEVISGDSHENIQEVWDLLGQSLWYANAILNGGKNARGKIFATEDPVVQGKIEGVRMHVEQFIEQAHVRYEMLEGKNGAGTPVDESFDAAFEELIKEADEAEAVIHSMIQKAHHTFMIARTQSKAWVLFLSVSAIIIAIILAFMISRIISDPLRSLSTAASNITTGNLSVDLPKIKGYDEVALLTQSFSKMVEGLQDADALETQLKNALGENAAMVADTSEDLSEASEIMRIRAEETTHQAESVASISNQTQENIQAVAEAVEGLSTTVDDISQRLLEARQGTETAMDMSGAMEEMIEHLDQSSLRIGSIIKVISAIAEQTNLLALNATIEAARAGKAGKGFAVVANEVKQLAKSTADATGEIRHQIATIQGNTLEVVGAIKDITEIIEQNNAISSSISDTMEKQVTTTKEISLNMGEAAKGADTLGRGIEHILKAAVENAKSADNIEASSKQFSLMADRFVNLLSNFIPLLGMERVENPRILPDF